MTLGVRIGPIVMGQAFQHASPTGVRTAAPPLLALEMGLGNFAAGSLVTFFALAQLLLAQATSRFAAWHG